MNWSGRIRRWIKNPKHRRSLGGLLMALIMAPFVISVLACIEVPAPIGDPETSKLNPKLSGVWLGKIDDDLTLLVLQPFDKRTYLIGWFGPESDEDTDEGENPVEIEPPLEDADEGENPEIESSLKDGANEDDTKPKGGETKLDQINLKKVYIFKGWLTTIGGQQFMCWEPKFTLNEELGMKPKEWLALKVKLKKNRLSLAFVGGKGKTTKKIEKSIEKDFLDDKNLGEKDWMNYRKIDKSKYDEVAEALEKMGLAIE